MSGKHPPDVPEVGINEDGYPERLWTEEEFLAFGKRYMAGMGRKYGETVDTAERFIATFGSVVNNDWAPGCCSVQMARYLKGCRGTLPELDSFSVMAMIITQFIIAATYQYNESVRLYQINITTRDFSEELIGALQNCGWTVGAQCESRYSGYDIYCMFFNMYEMEESIGLEHPLPA